MEQALARRGQQDIVREGYFDLSPRSLGEAIQLAELMAKSELIPTQFRNKPGDVLIAVQYGAEIGLKPLQAMQGIAVINGRPTIWGDAALGVVLQSGLLENYKEMTFEEIEKAGKAVFWGKRKGLDEPIIREFSIENAKKAGLWDKPGPWKQYPFRMMQMRARAFGLRDGWADALKGMAVREEVQDYEPTAAPAVLAMPRRISERQIEAAPEPPAEIHQPDPPPLDPAELDRLDQREAGGIRTSPPCPKCGGDTKLMPAGKKTNGQDYPAFWSCLKYPECKGTVKDSDFTNG